MPHFFQSFYSFFVSFVIIHNFPLLILCILLLFTRCATSNASRHFKSPLAMGRDAFKSKHASSVSISEVIDTGVNSILFLLNSCQIFYNFSCNDQTGYRWYERNTSRNIPAFGTFVCCPRRTDTVRSATDRHIFQRPGWLFF